MAENEVEIKVKARDESSGVFAKVRQELDKLKRVAGGRSTLKELVETASGAGAVAAVALTAAKVAEFTGEVGKLAIAWSGAEKAEHDMLREAVNLVPGGEKITQFADGVRDLVAGI